MTDPLIEFRSQDLHADGLRLQLTVGYAEPLNVRGKDTIVPHLAGRIVRARMGDNRILRLEGFVAAGTPEVWRIATDLLALIIDTTLDPGDLILRGPYLGLPVPTTASITARVLNAVGGPIMAKLYQRWSIELESVDPFWVVTSS